MSIGTNVVYWCRKCNLMAPVVRFMPATCRCKSPDWYDINAKNRSNGSRLKQKTSK